MAPLPPIPAAATQPMAPIPGAGPIIAPPSQVTPWQSTAPPLLPTTSGPLQETATIQQVRCESACLTVVIVKTDI